MKAGSKEEEIMAICKIHGVDEKAPLSLVLKVCIVEILSIHTGSQINQSNVLDQCNLFWFSRELPAHQYLIWYEWITL